MKIFGKTFRVSQCRSQEDDVSSWESVAFYLSNMSNAKYYKDPVVIHGYYPGIYAVSFAESIVKRYKHYQNVIPK